MDPPAQGKHAKHAAAPVACAASGRERDGTGAACRQASGRARAAQSALRTRHAALAEVATCDSVPAAARGLETRKSRHRPMQRGFLEQERTLGTLSNDRCRRSWQAAAASAPKRRQRTHLGLKMRKVQSAAHGHEPANESAPAKYRKWESSGAMPHGAPKENARP